MKRNNAKINLYFIKVSLLVLTFFLSSDVYSAQKQTKKRRDIKAEVFNRADRAFLSKNREKAAKVLREFLETKGGKKSRAEVHERLERVLTMFFTENGQKLFEQSNSIYFTNPILAETKYLAAHEVEPKNVLVIEGLARVLIKNGKCEQAASHLKDGLDLYSKRKPSQALLVLAYDCQGNVDLATRTLKEMESEGGEKGMSGLHALPAKWSYLNSEFTNSFEYSSQCIKKDMQFPECYYWLWKNRLQREELALSEGQKYLSICKKLNRRVVKRYYNNPRICLNKAEVANYVENELSKKNSTSN